MEHPDKKIDFSIAFTSLKRIECLLEEILFRQIIANTNSEEEASKKFDVAMENVNKSMEHHFNSLPNADES